LSYAQLIFLKWLGLVEGNTELLGAVSELCVPVDVIELDAFPQFPVTNWAENDGVTICLRHAHRAHHQALVENAVAQTEHMPDFVRGYFDDPLELPALHFAFG
jgi:hypothetical protein